MFAEAKKSAGGDDNIKGRDQWEWIGLWKVAIDRHLVRIVVTDVLFDFNLAAILE